MQHPTQAPVPMTSGAPTLSLRASIALMIPLGALMLYATSTAATGSNREGNTASGDRAFFSLHQSRTERGAGEMPPPSALHRTE
jgi:hypothetical protein